MRFARLVMILAILVSGEFTFAATDAKTEAAIKKLVTEYTPHVATLTRDVRVYHWTYIRGEDPEKIPVRHPVFLRLMNVGMSGFWRLPSNRGGALGAGVYAALDPNSSRHYGDSLMEITIKKGAKVLNFWLNVGTDEVKKEVIKRLGVVGFLYDYTATAKICSTISQKAILLTGIVDEKSNRATMQGLDVIGLVKRVSRENAEAADAYDRIEKFIDEETGVAMGGAPQIFPGKYQPMNEQEKADWREHIYTCDNLHLEDRL